MEQVQYDIIAEDIFKRIQGQFPSLKMTIDHNDKNLDLSMDINKQTGLDFDINLNLQTDELFISTEYINGSFFPLKDPIVAETFEEICIGLIKGEYRIVQLVYNNKIYKSFIQKLDSGIWINVFRRRILFVPPWAKLQERIYINNFKNPAVTDL